MIVRRFGNKLKFCRLYDDDVFGNLNIRPKNSHKILNIIFIDFYKKDFFYKSLIKKLRFFRNKLKRLIYKYYNKYVKSLVSTKLHLKNFGSDSIKFFVYNFFVFFKKKTINFDIFLYFLKRLRNKGLIFFKKVYVKKFKHVKFNYRVDQGKPKREKKKVTLYCTRLLTRHKLRFFSSRMSVRQFRSYVKKKRNSKFFGMVFIFSLESRLDTVLYRMNLQVSSFKTRQYIRHFGVLINDVFVNIPSYNLNFNDFLSLINKKQMYQFLLFKFYKKLIFMYIPTFYEISHRLMTIIFYKKPNKKTIFFPFSLDIGRLGGLGERF